MDTILEILKKKNNDNLRYKFFEIERKKTKINIIMSIFNLSNKSKLEVEKKLNNKKIEYNFKLIVLLNLK